jgi:hypothetical protein
MNDDQRYEGFVDAAQCAHDEGLKTFNERIEALNHDLETPAFALSWAALATYVFDFLCSNGINPLQLERSLLENVLDNLTDGLGNQGWQWELTVNTLMENELPKIPVDLGGEEEDEGVPDQPEDAHLEALYEDRYGYPEDVYDDIYGGRGSD